MGEYEYSSHTAMGDVNFRGSLGYSVFPLIAFLFGPP